MKPQIYPWDIPDVILLVGTDASGKDHVANALVEMIRESGGEVEKRQRYFSGRKTSARSSEEKGVFDTLQEKVFLLIFERLAFMLPLLISVVILADLWLYRAPDRKKLVVVGHNGLRALAFHLAQKFEDPAVMKLPWYLRMTLKKLKKEVGAHVIVLDVEDHVRQKRIAARLSAGSEDTFDRYMHSDGERSERIEACLVHMATQFLGAALLENNDLSDEELQREMRYGFPAVD